MVSAAFILGFLALPFEIIAAILRFLVGGTTFRKYKQRLILVIRLTIFRKVLLMPIKDTKYISFFSVDQLLKLIGLVHSSVTKTLPNYGEKFDDKSTWLVRQPDAKPSDPIIIYLHGGGYFLQTMPEQVKSLTSVYKLLTPENQKRTSILLLDYSLVSYNHKLPKQVLELDQTYSKLVSQGRDNILLLGDSAGGNLAISYTQFLHLTKRQTVYPSKLLLVSPWVGLTPTPETHFIPGESYHDNINYDLINFKQFKADHFNIFIDDKDIEKASYFHWCVSPNKVDNWKDIPSYGDSKHDVFIILGEDESFRDDIVRWSRDALHIDVGDFKYGSSNNAIVDNHEIVSEGKQGRANVFYYVEPWGVHDALFFMEDDALKLVKKGAKVSELDTTRYFGITRLVNFLNDRL